MLSRKLDRDEDNLDLNAYSVSTVALCLKKYLRSTSSPIIPVKLYPNLIQIQEKQRGPGKLVMIAAVLSETSHNSQRLLSYLLDLLVAVSLNQQVTQMSAANLGYTFAPCLLQPGELGNIQKAMQEQKLANELMVELIVNKDVIFENMISAEGDEVKWVNDDMVLFCSKCGSKFGIMRRRHHCRACGQIFCAKCTHKVDKQRICHDCNEK